ncbi:hypothetical protein [Noviherbaspirillum sedimenti]|uniref:hypothetical protein n=1 Tax=Noviherbaspirillum sedimenti TaxID=2320865 RepID=UPI0011C3C887|nr:hypothetical protein [Noviherbaspirillum sedimenti]
MLLEIVHQTVARFIWLCPKKGQGSGDKNFFPVIQGHGLEIVFTVHPAMRQVKTFLDDTGQICANILAIAFDMTEVALRQLQVLGKQFQHAVSWRIRMPVYEIMKQFHKISVSNLGAIQEHLTTFVAIRM